MKTCNGEVTILSAIVETLLIGGAYHILENRCPPIEVYAAAYRVTVRDTTPTPLRPVLYQLHAYPTVCEPS